MSEVLSFSNIESAMSVFKLEFVDICNRLSLRVGERPEINELSRSTLLSKLKLLSTCTPHIPLTPTSLLDLLEWTNSLDEKLDCEDFHQQSYDEIIKASVLASFH